MVCGFQPLLEFGRLDNACIDHQNVFRDWHGFRVTLFFVDLRSLFIVSLFARLDPYLEPTYKFGCGLLTIYGHLFGTYFLQNYRRLTPVDIDLYRPTA